jgi:hypothetical protein
MYTIFMLYTLLGWIGLFLLVTAHLLLSTDKLGKDTYMYHGMNLIGAIGIVLNALAVKAYPILVLNVFWAGISLVELFEIKKKN